MTINFLTPEDTGNRAFSQASTSSMLIMIGIVFLLIPLLIHAWRDQRTR